MLKTTRQPPYFRYLKAKKKEQERKISKIWDEYRLKKTDDFDVFMGEQVRRVSYTQNFDLNKMLENAIYREFEDENGIFTVQPKGKQKINDNLFLQINENRNLCKNLEVSAITLCLNAQEIGIETKAYNTKARQYYRILNNQEIAKKLINHLQITISRGLKKYRTWTTYVLERHYDGTPHIHATLFCSSFEKSKILKILTARYPKNGAVGEVCNPDYLLKVTSKTDEGKIFNTAKIYGVQADKKLYYITHNVGNSTSWLQICKKLQEFFAEQLESKKRQIQNRKLKRIKPAQAPKNREFVINKTVLVPYVPAPKKTRKREIDKINMQVRFKGGRYHFNYKFSRKITINQLNKFKTELKKQAKNLTKKEDVKQVIEELKAKFKLNQKRVKKAPKIKQEPVTYTVATSPYFEQPEEPKTIKKPQKEPPKTGLFDGQAIERKSIIADRDYGGI
ncbi:hypothetical protein [Campylobacter geochelonis]|uniref:Uncharacterized protein n=1 Tax=Campylobacter geochelonis TaxID=1780362 RepID=A0A128EB48_9BACT|nr:hypothetical protein [Campylobacter geochelonis]QKF70473.1 hypothetical protein CGEO_0133 [Campylobacter geochelonis]CZE46214.1 Uncharacterised protein [Campylobacter geochelonis]